MKLTILLIFFARLAAAVTPINSLPITITAPGTYVLTHDMTFTLAEPLITISVATGPVILDFQGFSITGGPPTYNYSAVQVQSPSGKYPTVIRNGTVIGFEAGIIVSFAPNVTITNMILDGNDLGIILGDCAPCTVSNCTFNGPAAYASNNLGGIWDSEARDTTAKGSTTYSNNVFVNIACPVRIWRAPDVSTPILLGRYTTQ